MCYEEFIREKKLTKNISVKYDASEYLAVKIKDTEYDEEISLPPTIFERIIKWYKEVEKELIEINKEEDNGSGIPSEIKEKK